MNIQFNNITNEILKYCAYLKINLTYTKNNGRFYLEHKDYIESHVTYYYSWNDKKIIAVGKILNKGSSVESIFEIAKGNEAIQLLQVFRDILYEKCVEKAKQEIMREMAEKRVEELPEVYSRYF